MMHKMGQSQDVNVSHKMMGMRKMLKKHVHMGMGMRKMFKKGVHMGMGMMGMMLVGRVRAIKKMNKGSWTLVKNNDGNCECKRGNVKKGKIILGRFHSVKDCETHRSHDC
jgi:hypothetical protein